MKPSRQFRPTLNQTDLLEDRRVLSTLHPYYHQRLPIYQPLQTQVLNTPTLPKIQTAGVRTYELIPPPGQVNPTGTISLSYKVGGATIVPFGYVYANAQGELNPFGLCDDDQSDLRGGLIIYSKCLGW